MERVGIVGAGVMGIGVAHSVAQAGYQVVLVDLTPEILDKAKAEIFKNIRFQGFFSKNLEAPEVTIERIAFTTDYAMLTTVDYVVENVNEQWELKREVYRHLDEICPPHCVFAANTSCISITKIAALTRRPDRVIGIHFMNPVPMKPAVEAIRGYHTSEATIETTQAFLTRLGKECILVNDLPGFVSNRLSHLLMNEAAYVVQDQVATPQDVDNIFKKCFGHKMGPLETADLIGLDTVVDSLKVLYESYQDPKFRVCPLLQKMVDAGLFGRKSGQGFYAYADGVAL
jgi:3-hydroxybutyryl-CoA dehydrogenase